jgi:rare lipoprotein A (peptidoglycan hydrolase)
LAQNQQQQSPTQDNQQQRAAQKQFSGDASYYNPTGHKTANGDVYDPTKKTGAIQADKVNLGKTVEVTYTTTDKQGTAVTKTVKVLINDRGPWATDNHGKALHPLQPHPTRIIDLSPAAFKDLVGSKAPGVVPVIVTVPNEGGK